MDRNNYILIIILINFSICQSTNNEARDEAIEYKHVVNENEWMFRYKTKDTEREEIGVVDKTEEGGGPTFVTGFYKFKGTDGKIYRVNYEADENGYRPRVSIQEKDEIIELPEIVPIPIIGSAVLGTLQGGGLG